MRPRTLWILLALVAALAAFVWFVERDLPGSDERAERAKRVLALETDEVTRIAWARGEERVGLVRVGEGERRSWRLEEPFSVRADDADVERLLDLLGGLEKQRTLESGEPGELGLDPPRALLTVETAAAERRLVVGGAVPASESMIVAAGDGPPYYVVEGGLWTELERPSGDWRSRDVFPGESDEVARLSLDGAGARITLARRGQDFWLEEPIVDRADEGTVSRFLAALTALEVEDFVDVAPATGQFGLEPSPAAVLDVGLVDGSSWRLELGAASDDGTDERVYARVGDAVIVVADAVGEYLALKTDEWRSLELVASKVFEIETVDVVDEEGSVSFARVGGQWERDGQRVDYTAVSDLLYALAGSKAEALGAEAAIEGEPMLSVTFNAGADEEILEVFRPRADRFPTRTGARETGLWLGGDRFRDIRSRLTEARAAEPLEASTAEAAGVLEAGDGQGSE